MKIEKNTNIPIVVEDCVNKMLDGLSTWFKSPALLKRDILCSKLKEEFPTASDNEIGLIYNRLCFKISDRIYKETKNRINSK